MNYNNKDSENIDRVGGRLNSRTSLKYNTFYPPTRSRKLCGLFRYAHEQIVYVGLMEEIPIGHTQPVTCKLALQQLASVVLSSRRFQVEKKRKKKREKKIWSGNKRKTKKKEKKTGVRRHSGARCFIVLLSVGRSRPTLSSLLFVQTLVFAQCVCQRVWACLHHGSMVVFLECSRHYDIFNYCYYRECWTTSPWLNYSTFKRPTTARNCTRYAEKLQRLVIQFVCILFYQPSSPFFFCYCRR